MQAQPPSVNPGDNGIPFAGGARYSPIVMRRANGLKAICVCELMLAVWGIMFTNLYWVFVACVPVEIIGILAARRLNIRMLTVFAFLKAALLGLFVLVFAETMGGMGCSGSGCSSESLVVGILFVVTVLISHLLGIFVAVKLRQDITISDTTPTPSVELHNIDEVPNSQIPHMSQLPQIPHMSQIPMPVPHFHQDPHSTAGVPGYPYPPPHQFYPTMYMNQGGYPTPYAHYPNAAPATNMPVSPYPSYTISDDQAQQQTRDTQPLL